MLLFIFHAQTEVNPVGADSYDVCNNPAEDIANFSKYYEANSVESIIVNNPQAEFLPQITPAIESGGTVTIRGGMSNKYFNKIFKSTKIEGYEILQKNENVPNLNYKQSDGVTPITGQINEVILKKI